MNATTINSRVLVLNRSFLPIAVTTVKRAFCMIYAGIAKVVDKEYQTFDFESWCALSVATNDETLGLVDRMIRVPRVVLLQTYDRIPRKQVRFSRYNIFARDRSTCQYCGKRHVKGELNLDHVIPRSQGGLTTWNNVVCSCVRCNRKKGGRTPEQAQMTLIRKPTRPHWTQVLNLSGTKAHYREWLPFLNVVDFSYWNVELEP